MECPYCKNEMKSGKIYTACNSAPYWLEDGKKRSVGDAVTGAGLMPAKNLGLMFAIEGSYCPRCRKVIVDADLGR